MNKLKIYISGKITGLPLKDAEANFYASQIWVVEKGHEPVNPMDILPYSPEHTWRDYMIADIKALLECNAIYMQANWHDSKGAKVEYELARALGFTIIHEENRDFAMRAISDGWYHIVETVCNEWDVPLVAVTAKAKNKVIVEARAIISTILTKKNIMSIRGYAKAFSLDYSGAYITYGRFADRLYTEPELNERFNNILKKL